MPHAKSVEDAFITIKSDPSKILGLTVGSHTITTPGQKVPKAGMDSSLLSPVENKLYNYLTIPTIYKRLPSTNIFRRTIPTNTHPPAINQRRWLQNLHGHRPRSRRAIRKLRHPGSRATLDPTRSHSIIFHNTYQHSTLRSELHWSRSSSTFRTPPLYLPAV
jgi:hypothetical protein